eukprot:10674488-Alexandrium_andersonii.AAC.1
MARAAQVACRRACRHEAGMQKRARVRSTCAQCARGLSARSARAGTSARVTRQKVWLASRVSPLLSHGFGC